MKKLIGVSLLAVVLLTGCAVKKSWVGKDSPTQKKVIELLESGQEVRLAMIGNVKTNMSASYFTSIGLDLGQWKRMNHDLLTEKSEAKSLNRYISYDNFSMIERYQIESVMREQYLSLTGVIRRADYLKLGELAGATHLLLWTMVRSAQGGGVFMDIYTWKLVDVGTGKILSSAWKERTLR